MPASVRHSPSYMHAMIAFGMFMIVVTLANGPLRGTLTEFSAEASAEIGVEHEGSASLIFDMSTLKGSSIIDLTNDAQTETIAVSVPSDWERREVRNASIREVVQEEPSFGFTRWTLPPRAVISFKVLRPPQEVLVHNPSETPLLVRVTRVDLDTDEVYHDAVLIQESAAELW